MEGQSGNKLINLERQRILSTYAKIAKERNLRSIAKIEDQLLVDRIEYYFDSGESGKRYYARVAAFDDPEIFYFRKEQLGHYKLPENGLMVFVDEKGQLRICPGTDGNIEKLRKAGYKATNDFLMPLRGMQVALDPKIIAEIERISELGRVRSEIREFGVDKAAQNIHTLSEPKTLTPENVVLFRRKPK